MIDENIRQQLKDAENIEGLPQQKDQKFIFQTLVEDNSSVCDEGYNYCCEQYINIRGTPEEAYNYYHYYEKLRDKFYQRYKISSDGVCEICKQEHKEIYNFCDNEHDGRGICFNCFTKMKDYKCPICCGEIIKFISQILLCKLVG